LDRHGPDGVTLRGAARAAGVSQAAPYRHFASKEALLAAVAADSFEALRAACEAVAPTGRAKAPSAWLEAVAVAYVRFALAHPARYRLMWAPSPRGRDHPALHAAAASAGAALAGALVALGTRGEDGMQRLFVLWSLLHGVTGLILDEQLPHEVLRRVPVDDLVRSAVRVLRDGLLHPEGRKRRR
jgi:AcrR family transcriptional regulator